MDKPKSIRRAKSVSRLRAPPKPSAATAKTTKGASDTEPEQIPAEPVEEVAAPAPVRTKKQTPIDIAIAKYQDCDWKVIKPAKGGLNDFIASRGNRIHFVQVVTKATIDDAKYHGEAKNNFVQNAFSNSAIPIFAHVVEGSKPKVTFEDVNTGNRAIVSSRSTKAKASDDK